MQIPRHIVDAVREQTDIVAVISRHVKLERRGQRWVGLCPFHQEKSPSFGVSQDKGLFYCFGCQAGGDVFRFLMQLEGLSFFEAVKELARSAGIELPDRELSPEEKRRLRQKANQYDVIEAACQRFESVLWTTPEGAPGRAYLEQRGMSAETARKARLGFAPAGWSRLLDALHRQGFSPEQLHEAGLVRERTEGGGFYDAFRERLMFPIRDARGRVVAFGGRLLEGDGPKYINSPETTLYQKSQVLYGLETARAAIQRQDRALLVEGYFDVLSLHQAGFEEAVATCGTALTPEHLERLRRLTRNVLVLLDADEAGARAAERALPMFLDAGVQAWRVEVPGAKDPDQLIQEEGPEALERALQQREPLVEWVVQRKLEGYGFDAAGRQRALEDLLPLLRRLPDLLVGQVAGHLRMRPDDLLERVRRAASAPEDAAPLPQAAPRWRPDREVVHLLWLLVHRHGQTADLVSRADPRLLEGRGPAQELVARLLGGEPVAAIVGEARDPEVTRVLLAIEARSGLYTEEQAAMATCEVLDRLAGPARERKLASLRRDMERALTSGELEAYREAAAARRDLDKLKSAFQAAIRERNPATFAALLDRATASRATSSVS